MSKKESKNSELPKLSASKIKTLQTCSFLYYSQYVLKLPRTSNDGASRGTVVHLVYEVFLNPRHRKHFDLILDKQDARADKAIWRMVLKNAKKLKVDDKENLDLINKMILVGMKEDFYCDGAIKIEAESEFNIKTDKYAINGFIDKKAIYPDNKIRIIDYKTSKAKFTDEEIDANMQSLMYSLACYKQAKVIPEIAFLFLREKEPLQKAETCTEDVLEGFEMYLEEVADYIKDFDEEKAKGDYAANDKKRTWLCGFAKYKGQLKKDGNPMWHCSQKFPYDYYALIDKDGKMIKSEFTEEELKPEEGQRVEKRFFAGCPRWNRQQKPTTDTNDFDF